MQAEKVRQAVDEEKVGSENRISKVWTIIANSGNHHFLRQVSASIVKSTAGEMNFANRDCGGQIEENNAERVGSENLFSNEHMTFRRLLMESPTVNLKNNCRRLTNEKASFLGPEG